jgi:hypothetical protein
METLPFQFSSFYMEFETWTINADRTSLDATVWESNSGEGIDTYTSSIEFGNGMYRIQEDDSWVFPYTFFSQSHYFVISNRNAFPLSDGTPLDNGISYLGFRMDAASQASLVGHWQGFQYEIETFGSQLINWGYEILEMEFSAENTVNFTVTESTNLDEVNETDSFSFTRNAGTIFINDEVEFKLSASGDILFRQTFEGDGTGLVTTLLKTVSPQDVTTQDMAGTWALGLTELARNNPMASEWTGLDSETALIDLRADGSGTLYTIQSTFLNRDYPDEEDAAINFGWSIGGSDLVIHQPGNPGDEWVRFVIGASKEIMRNIEFEADSWGEFLMAEYLIKIDTPIQPEVKTIPYFSPGVDYFGTWFAQDTEIYTKQWPWIHFSKLGWMRILEGNGLDVWLYDTKLQRWLVTDTIIFPYALGTAAGEVYFIDLENSTPQNRSIYSYHEGTWLD